MAMLHVVFDVIELTTMRMCVVSRPSVEKKDHKNLCASPAIFVSNSFFDFALSVIAENPFSVVEPWRSYAQKSDLHE